MQRYRETSWLDCRRIQFDQLAGDLGDFQGGFLKAVMDPGSDDLCGGTGIEFRLITDIPNFQTPDLAQAMLQDRPFQQIKQSALLDKAKPFPLRPEIGIDRQNMLAHAALGNGDLTADLLKQGNSILVYHILRQVKVAIKGGMARPGFF